MSDGRVIRVAPPACLLAVFKVLGAQAPALRKCIISTLNGERPAGSPSRTLVFNLTARDVRPAQASA